MPPQPAVAPRVVLSTSSVYPESTAAGFALTRDLGYDGIEIMVGVDPASADVDSVARLSEYHEVPVLAIHAPTLLLTQRVWGPDPWEKLDRAAMAAHQLGADVVVVHPPFRWQRSYASGFTDGIRRLEETTGLTFAVENMFPWRGPGGGEVRAYSPSWDCAALDVDHLTLDLSHAATSRLSSLQLVRDWGERLRHVHLTDGTDGVADEHLLPGEGDQDAAGVLAELAATGYTGHVSVEVKTRGLSRAQRAEALAASLAFTRAHLAVPAEPHG
ncbi:sugar phosphate isomerase/epimerase family protein [Propionicimonas sp.]|uniref:sugar phosphate isomerase/epimerase family protein n=1 Tax=Propionicimonas sp. TaxID=1955623 RepID=UPI0039E6D2F9